MKKSISLFALVLPILMLILTGSKCKQGSTTGGTPKDTLSPQEYTDLRHALIAYMECEECENGELEALKKFGEKAVPSLTATLNDGPSPAKTETYRKQLEQAYTDLSNYNAQNKENKIEMSQEQYISTYMENYVALYKMKAARALGAIGGANAKNALEAALQNKSQRADITNEIEMALKALK